MSIGSPIQFQQNHSAHSQQAMLHPVFSGTASSLPCRASTPAPEAHSAVFSCSITHASRRVAVEIIGEIDRTSAGQFRNQLLTLAKEHPVAIAIDMKHVALPDEAAVAVLVETWRFAQEHGIELSVTSPPPAVRDAFELAPSGKLLTLRT
jgi:anti-anti-sigma factor